MRAILLLLSILAFSITIVAQEEENSRPTQQQILAQKQQALADAKKERDQARKQLAEAKANNDDPESIKQREKMLASMDQMIAMLERTDLTGNKIPETLPPSKNTEPAYVSPFMPIKLNKPVKAPTRDEAKDKLLWYRGKKIDANTLITPTRMIVRYNRQSRTITLQPPKPGPDTIYYGMVNTLGRIRQMKIEFSTLMDNVMNSFFMFPEIEDAYKEFDVFKNRYYEMTKNTRQVPAAGNSTNNNTYLESQIQALEQFVASLPPVQIIMPPERPNDLCLCINNPVAKRTYYDNSDAWLNQFYSEEIKIEEMLKGIYATIDFINQIRHTIPSVPASIDDPTPYVQIILDRMRQKVEELSKKYEQGNVLIEDGLFLVTYDLLNHVLEFDVPQLSTTRTGISNLISKIKGLIESNLFEKYIEDQKARKNFNAVFDYGLYAAHELIRKAFTAKSDINQTFFQKWYKSLRDFNRFKLTVELDFHYQISDENGNASFWANGLLRNNADVYVALGKRDCHWVLYLSEVDHRNRKTGGEEFKIPMKVISGQKDYINDNKPAFNYTGPPIMKMVAPTYYINFCGSGSEAMMDVLSFPPADIKRHENDDPKKVYTLDIMAYVNKMLIGIKKTEADLTQMIDLAGEMMNMTTMGQVVMTHATGDAAFDRMKAEYLGQKKKFDLQKSLGKTTHTGRTEIPLITTGAPTGLLFKPTYDMTDPADKDRKVGIVITKALVTLKAEHAPR